VSERGTLLVTGGSRGIGAATARLAGAAGYAVALGYRADEDAARQAAAAVEAAGGRACVVQGDVARWPTSGPPRSSGCSG
jgi:NAD(P)-dependent dehydrogenase (short-subunit alcohol dehydrogenase family)